MGKKLSMLVISLLFLLLMCTCEHKKLPLNQKLYNLFKVFELLEKNIINEVPQFIDSKKSDINSDLANYLLCLYTSKSCEPRFLENDLESNFATYVGKVINRDTSDLRQIVYLLHPHLEGSSIFPFFEFYNIKLLGIFNKHQKPKEPNNLNSEDEILNFLVYHYGLAIALSREGEEMAASACYGMLIRMIDLYELETKYPNLISRLYIDASRFYLVSQQDSLASTIYTRSTQLKHLLPDSFWNLDVESSLKYLVGKNKNPREVIAFLGRSNFENIDNLHPHYASKLYLELINLIEYRDKALTKNLLKKVLDINDKSPCSSSFIHASDFLVEIYLGEGEFAAAEKLISKISSCTELKENLQFVRFRCKEIYNAALCELNLDINNCEKAYEIKLQQDSLMKVTFQDNDALHVTDHYARAAISKFEYLENLSNNFDSDRYKQMLLNELDKTKYTIFEYRNNYDEIYVGSTNKKMRKIDDNIHKLQLEINNKEPFKADLSAYFKLLNLQLNKIDIIEQLQSINSQEISKTKQSIEAIQHQLGEQSLQILEYYQFREHLRIFVINPDTFYQQRIEYNFELDSIISNLKNNQKNVSDKSSNIQNRKKVYKALIENHVDKAYENLILVPDGALNGLSFESLVDSKQEALHSYFNVSYSYGIKSSYDFNNTITEAKKITFLGFSDEETMKNYDQKTYVELYGGYREVEECKKILPVRNIQTYNGYDCTYENLIKSLQSDISHFATHAVSDPENGIGNYFITRTDHGTRKTYGFEINNVSAQSTLAILSACETGIGKFEAGEGVFSLSRNLQQAGVPTVIKTLWKVDDTQSSFLMQYFYERIVNGEMVGEALSNAKKDFIKYHSPDPYYWSAYVLEGNPFISFKF